MKKDRSNFSATEYSAQNELARIRNTFSFRFGLLVTESFVRKPWLMPLFPFRFMGLFLPRLDTKKIEYKNNDGPETHILFSTSEEGPSTAERALKRSADLERQGKKVINITSSRQGSQILEEQTLFLLPDPKNKTAVKSTTEWNETCLNFLHHIVMSNNVTTLEFDGPYPYRGVLNLMKIHPHVKTVWRRLDTKVPTNSTHVDNFDELDIIELELSDFSKPRKPVLFGNEEPKSILMGLGYDHRDGNAKGRNHVIQQLKRKGNHHVIIFDHLQLSNQALSPIPVTRWGSSVNKLLSENIQFAVVPPNPMLLEPLSMRGIPTMIICDESVPVQTLAHLRKLAFTQPISVLKNPDADEIRIGLAPFLEERIKPPNFIH